MAKQSRAAGGQESLAADPLPPELQEEDADDLSLLEQFIHEGAKHYIYRFIGPSSTSKRELAGRIDDVPRPDPHDIGTVYGSGLYVMISKYRTPEGGLEVKTSKVFRVAADYGAYRTVPPAAAPAAVPPAAAPAAVPPASAVDLSDQTRILKDLLDMVKGLQGEPRGSEPLSLKGIKELIETQALVMKAQRDLMFSQLPTQIISLLSPPPAADGSGGGLEQVLGNLLKGAHHGVVDKV